MIGEGHGPVAHPLDPPLTPYYLSFGLVCRIDGIYDIMIDLYVLVL